MNIAEIAVSFPAPQRIVEDGAEVFGYRGHVIFPLHVIPKESNRPVQLALTLSYAVCAGICIPGKGEAKLTLFPGQAASGSGGPEASAIAEAETLVPVHLNSLESGSKFVINPDLGAALPTWRISPRGGVMLDVFAEAPPGWYFDTRASERPNEFLIVEAERPPSANSKRPPVSLTAKIGQQSFEFEADLDSAPNFLKSGRTLPETALRANQK